MKQTFTFNYFNRGGSITCLFLILLATLPNAFLKAQHKQSKFEIPVDTKLPITEAVKKAGCATWEEYYEKRYAEVEREHELSSKFASYSAFNGLFEKAAALAKIKEYHRKQFYDMLYEKFLYKDKFELNNSILTGKLDKLNGEQVMNEKVAEYASYYQSMFLKGITTFYPDITYKKSEDNFTQGQGGGGTPNPQAPCTNVDFELQNFSGWTGNHTTWNCSASTPNARNVAGLNIGAINSTAAQHTIMTGGNDPTAGAALPLTSPLGGTAIARLSDAVDGCDAADLEQTFTVSATNSNFTYAFAVVMYDGHPAADAPKFTISMTDQAGNPINCAAYTVDATQAAAGNGFVSAGGGLYYKPWSQVFVPLSGYIGQNVTIRFISSDCNGGAHRGYAYVDCRCQPLQVISSSPSVCNGANTTLTAPAGAATYSWTTPNGNIVSGSNGQIATVNQPGQYQVTMTAFGSGCSYVIDTIIPGGVINPTASFTGTNVCITQATNFTDASTGGVTSWAWNFGDGNTSSNQNPTHIYAAAGTYTVQLDVSNGCPSTYTTTVTVYSNSIANFSSNQVCPGGLSSITNLSTAPPGATYFWDYGDGQNETNAGGNVTHTYATANTYNVTLQITAPGGCNGNVTLPVIVNPNPVPQFTSVGVCLNTPSPFNNTTPAIPAITNWSWDFTNDGTSDDLTQSPSFTYPTSGTFVASLTATSAAGCVGTYTTNVTVHPNPVPAFTATTVCLGSPTSFDNSTSTIAAPDNIAFYNWTFGDGNNASGSNPSHTYATCGTFTTNLVTVSNNNCTNNVNVTVTVNCPPSIAAPANITECPAMPITIPAFAPVPANASVNWTSTGTLTGLASSSGTGTIPSYTSAANSTGMDISDVITLTPVSFEGCPGPTQSFTVSVRPTPFVDPVSSVSVCANAQVNVPAFTSQPVGSSFSWLNTNASTGLAASGNGAILPFFGLNIGATTNSSQIDVTPTLNGCIGPVLSFTIDVLPLPHAIMPSNATYCPGVSIPASNFTSVPVGATYSWVNSNTLIGLNANGNGNQPSFIAGSNTSGGNYLSTITVTPSLNGCIGPDSTYTIGIYPQPLAIVPSSSEACPGANISSFTFNSLPADPTTTYSWSHTNANVGLLSGSSGIVSSPSTNAFMATNTSTTLISTLFTVVSTLNGCNSNPQTFTFTVNPLPEAIFSASHTCEGSSTSFDGSASQVGSGSIQNWAWDFNNDGTNEISSNSPLSNYSINGTGSQNVQLTVTTDKGCIEDTVLSFFINLNPIPTIAVNDPDGCPDHSVVLSGGVNPTSLDHPNSIVSWSWDADNNGQANANISDPGSENNTFPFTYTNSSPLNSAYYQVTLTVTSDSGCVGSLTTSNPQFITVYPKPVADFTWGPAEPLPNVENPNVLFNDQSLGATTWSWNFGDNQDADPTENVSLLQNPSHYYASYEPGVYDVELIVTNQQCADTIIKPVQIQPSWTFFIPNAFTPNSDGINDGFKGTGVGISEEGYNLWIFDRWGNMIFYSNNLEEVWDGKVQGRSTIVQQDVYVWKVKFKDFTGGKHEQEGIVTVAK